MVRIRPLILVFSSMAILIACNDLEDKSGNLPPDMHPSPEYHLLNTKEGYSIHPVKGDTIEPVLMPSGDTLITGVPIELKGRILDTPELEKKTVNAGSPRVIDFESNKYRLSDLARVIPLKREDVKKYTAIDASSSSSSSFATNMEDQTASMAYITIPAKFVEASLVESRPTPASSPEFRDTYSQNIRYLDVEQGMNSSRVRSLLQDVRGDIWIGTHGGGVTKYDGERFSFYNTENGLSDNIISALHEDSQGNIWFGASVEGISMYDGKTLQEFSANDLIANAVLAITEDSQGNVWIGGDNGIYKYDGTELTWFGNLEGSVLRITSVIQANDGKLWFGTMQHGFISYDGSQFTRYILSDNTVAPILSLIDDDQGNLWIGTEDKGVYKFDGSQFTHYNVQVSPGSKTITSLLQDTSGNIWLGTDGDGLIKIDGDSFSYITTREGLSDNSINAILEDRNGQIWAGTKDGGVSIVKNKGFVHLAELESMNASNVRAIWENEKGDYWFATWGGGVIIKKHNQFFQYSVEHGLISNTLWDMLIDKQGHKWFGGRGGLTRFDGQQFVNYPLEDMILSLLQTSDGTIWIGTGGLGLISYDGEKFTQYSTKEGFNGDIIWSMIEDKEGDLWITTWGGGGMAKYDGKHFTFYSEREGLIHNDIWSVFEDRRGNLWFGSFGEGIGVFDGEGFINITKTQGLPNNIVCSITEDPNGNIWVGTEKGLSKFEVNQDVDLVSDIEDREKPPYKLVNYSSKDGLIAEDFNVHTVYLDRRNRMWWGTGKSLVSLDLTTALEKDANPRVKLDQIEAGGRFVDYTNPDDLRNITFSGIHPFTNFPEDLEVPFKQNHLTFHFSVEDANFPSEHMYSYKLAGISENWSLPTTEAKADYRNLPYGEHELLVTTTNKAMEWSEPLMYNFTVLPPWWQTWWARIAYLILTVATVSGIIRWRTASIKQSQRELEKMVDERTREVVEQQKRSDELLLNILPANVAQELKETGKIEPVLFEEVSILFADFKDFTNIVASIPSKKLISELNDIFQSFDDIVEQRGLEKINTVGDAYVAAGGLPNPDPEHARKCVVAAKDMISYLTKRNEQSSIKWKVRIGIHSGPITAGVVGKRKFSYDVFGDTINVAARVESASDAGRINVSAYTHDLIKEFFPCEYRGKINAKGKGDLDMYFVQ